MEAKERNFQEMLETQWSRGNFVCVGLDSEFGKIPESVHGNINKCDMNVANTVVAFNQAIVEATKDLVCAYKPNFAFYIRHGIQGIEALIRTVTYIQANAPDVPVIMDAKFGDIGNTNLGYVEFAFDVCKVDAVTVHNYLGMEAMKPFLDRKNKGIIVLCRTSNPGAGEFQDYPATRSMYELVAFNVVHDWNYNGNCAVVAGATSPKELGEIRYVVGDMPILIPGIGAQGGDVEATVKAGKDSRGQGMIINSSRGIIFASQSEDFAEAARRETEKLHNLINQYR